LDIAVGAAILGSTVPPARSPRRPFPQHVGHPGCGSCIRPNVEPSRLDRDIQAYYDGWKAGLHRTFTTGPLAGESYLWAAGNGHVLGWPANVVGATQSEAHGYGLLICALMAGHDPEAQALFDSMNRVRRAFPSCTDPRLMSWAIPQTGDPALPAQPPATDGDLDMAYALLLAHEQWGNQNDDHYLAEAKEIIAGMKARFITAGRGSFFPRLNIGDPQHAASAPPESKPGLSRPSDYMIDHMLAFAAVTGDPAWSELAQSSLQILTEVSHPRTGLVPDFVVGDPPVPSATGCADEGLGYDRYDLNSCRVPWRQAVAVAHFGVPRSRAVADKMVSWARRAFDDDPARMTSVFTLAGESKRTRGAANFTSPMIAAGITSAAHQTWLDQGWDYMKASNPRRYYAGTLTLLCMLLVSGNWWPPISAGVGPRQ
jgi:endo-1,4-beta-D-glucanase Y